VSRLVRPTLFWLGWWCVLFPLWLVFVGAWDLYDGVAGVAAAAVAATAALVVRELGLLSFRPRVGGFSGFARVPLQVFADFGILAVALVRTLAGRPVRGIFLAKKLPTGGRGSEAAFARALAAIAATYSPNAYVVDVDLDRNVVLMHDLVRNSASEEPL
jgi:multisubunit Na+/H+ antiporter MnhE subunit